MKQIVILMLLVCGTANATIIAPNGDVTYVNETPVGYTAINATTNESTVYLQSGSMTTVIPDNGLGTPQTYMTTEGEAPLLLDQGGEE